MVDEYAIEDIADNAEDDVAEANLGDLVTDDDVYGEATDASGV